MASSPKPLEFGLGA